MDPAAEEVGSPLWLHVWHHVPRRPHRRKGKPVVYHHPSSYLPCTENAAQLGQQPQRSWQSPMNLLHASCGRRLLYACFLQYDTKARRQLGPRASHSRHCRHLPWHKV